MSYDIFNYIAIGALVLSIVMLIATVLIFFLLNIRGAIGDITGSNKRKAIENIHNQSAVHDPHPRSASKVDYESKTTSARLAHESMETAKIRTQDRYDSMEASETTSLNTSSSETTVLSAAEASQTTVLSAAEASETTVLGAAEVPQTTVITSEIPGPVLQYNNAYADFVIEVDITHVHSQEVVR